MQEKLQRRKNRASVADDEKPFNFFDPAEEILNREMSQPQIPVVLGKSKPEDIYGLENVRLFSNESLNKLNEDSTHIQ